jgi:guanosine-3',5'-bis(diphosphate) 3'-pyrophosphohydrolase
MQRGTGDSLEFLEHVKVDLFPDEVYVFTPRGQIMVLPKGATLVDFAYAIHSDVGNTCVAARIDRRLAPLRTVLHSGQTVEIINAPGAVPNAAWLSFVVTGKARANVRAYLKNLQRKEAEALGRRLLDAELEGFGVDLDEVAPERIDSYLANARLGGLDALLADVGLGNRMPALVARRLLEEQAGEGERDHETDVHPHRLSIKGTEGMVVAYARCCRPIPGDAIAGVFSPGKGIVVHRQECRNLGDFHRQRDKWLDVEWDSSEGTDFSTEIRVEVGNRPGALATVAAAIAEQGSNIENVQSREKDGLTSTLDFLITVHSRAHLARIMRRLRQIPLVVRISRVSR